MNCFKLFLTAVTAIAFLLLAQPNQSLSQTSSDSSDAIDKVLLDRVTVVGQPIWRSNIPGAASYVSAEQLQKQKYSDINRILRSISGVNIQEEDGFGLRPNIGLRGAGSERSSKINIMEDGILAAPAPYSAPAAYYFPNVSRMKSIEVRKGSSQIKYGPNTTGGALNLISTPIPTELSGNAEFSLGERNSNNLYANFGNRKERFGYLIEASQLGDDGFKELDGGGNTGYFIRDILGKFMVKSSPDASVYQRFELKIGYHTETSNETYLGLSRDDFNKNPFRRYAASQVDEMNTNHTQFLTRHVAILSKNVDLTTSLYRNDFTREWYKLNNLNTNVATINTGSMSSILANPSANSTELSYLRGADSPDDALTVRNNNREYFSQGIESILGLNLNTGSAENQLELGFRLHQDEEDRFQFEDDYRMENGEMILTTPGVPGEQNNRIGSATALSVFVQDKIKFNRFTFTPGLRYENIWFTNEDFGRNDVDRTGQNLRETNYTVNVFLPGFGTTYQATDDLSVIAGIHRGFSPPSPSSPIETESEKSVNYEFGFRYDVPRFQAEIIGFFNNYSNLLGSDLAAAGGSGTTAQFNAGEVEVVGLEITANTDLASLFGISSVSLPFNNNYTFTNATFQSSFDSGFKPWGEVQQGDEIPFIPKHQFNSSLSIEAQKLITGLNASYQPAMRTTAGSGSIPDQLSTDSYFLLDFQSSYSLNSDLSIFANVRNLLDNEYIVSDRPAGVRPGLPRTIIGGISVQF